MKLKAIFADNAYLLKIVFRHARGYAALTVCTAILIAADNVAALRCAKFVPCWR